MCVWVCVYSNDGCFYIFHVVTHIDGMYGPFCFYLIAIGLLVDFIYIFYFNLEEKKKKCWALSWGGRLDMAYPPSL